MTKYYSLLETISQAKADRDYRKAISAAQETFAILEEFVRESMREDDGVLAIETIPAIDVVGPMMAVMGDRDAIAEMAAAVEGVEGLEEWADAGEWASGEADLVDRILEAVAATPGLKQSNLKAATGASDGRRLATLARWLEDAHRIARVRVGSTYELYPEGTRFSTSKSASSQRAGEDSGEAALVVGGKTLDRRAIEPTVIDLSGLPYVRLPIAPPAWEERVAREGTANEAIADGSLFTVEGIGWFVDEPQKLANDEKPDPAFKRAFFTATHSYLLNPRGRSKGYESCPAILRVFDRSGAITAERGLAYDVYRDDVNFDGSGILFLSRDAVLHGYDNTLSPVILTTIGGIPEYQVAANRLEIAEREIRNHVRCISLSNDTRSYLFTVADEAWCMHRSGAPVWGLRMPTPEEWTRRSARTEKCGTSVEVADALDLMGLELPASPDEITQTYRQIAMETHPDRNSAPNAVEKMQELNAAMDLLTGTDLSDLTVAATEAVTYEKILSHQRVDFGQGIAADVEIRMVVSEAFAADWIYAADFAASDASAYVAGYGGRVIAIASDGAPKRVYDIGAVPRRIIDTGEHLYILTDTRLYVLAEDRLEALVDIFGQGELLVGETGFGLLEDKSLLWFSPAGELEGRIRSRDPIRRLFSAAEGLVIETRRHRTVVRGAPSWWTTDAE